MLKQKKQLKQSQVLSVVAISALCAAMAACGPTRKLPKVSENKAADAAGTTPQGQKNGAPTPGTQADPSKTSDQKTGDQKTGDAKTDAGLPPAASISEVEYRIDAEKKTALVRIAATDAASKTLKSTSLIADLSKLSKDGVELLAAPGTKLGYSAHLACESDSCESAKVTLTEVAVAPASSADSGKKSDDADKKAEPAKVVLTLKQTDVKYIEVTATGAIPEGTEKQIHDTLFAGSEKSTRLTITQVEGGAQLFWVDSRLPVAGASEVPNAPPSGDQIVLVSGRVGDKSAIKASYSDMQGDLAPGSTINPIADVTYNPNSNTVTIVIGTDAGISKMVFGDHTG